LLNNDEALFPLICLKASGEPIDTMIDAHG
jgi:hypothetical protein